jgi:hypothetical protein
LRRQASIQATTSPKSASVCTLRNVRKVSIEKRMGGLSMTRQPAASISTARNSLIADRRLNLPQGFQFRKQVLIWSLVVLMSAGRLSLSAFSSCTAFTRSATE